MDLSVDEAVNRLLEFNSYLSNGPLTRSIVEKSADTIDCTGGFGSDLEKVESIMKTPYLNSLGMPNYGEGITLMEEVGAIDWDATPFLHACQLAESKVTSESNAETLAGFSNSSLTQMLMSPLLWVDASGARFANEDVIYDTAFWSNAAYAVGGKYYFIVDKATLEDYTKGTSIRISEAGPGPNKDMDANKLEATVLRYNGMVSNQKDTDYNKSSDSLKYTVETGDYYAFDCRAVILGTIGGVKVNEKLEVINLDYKPIKGLYTAGTNAAGYYEGKGYPPYEGLACGFAWTSGRIAGESAARYVANK